MDEQADSGSTGDRVVGLAGALLDDQALHDLLQRLTLLAKHSVPGSESASITVNQDGRYRTSNSTGPDALAIDEAQYADQDGPCLEALRSGNQLQVKVAEQQKRWPKFAEAASEAGVGRVLSTPLLTTRDSSVGALNVYAGEVGAFEDQDLRTAQLLAEHAAILVARALDLLQSNRLNEQLGQAVATREIIGAAKGILMESQKCDRDQAFDILRRASQRDNRKLRDVAEELVLRVEARAGKRTGST